MLGRRIAARQPHPTCLPKLRRALPDEWCNIPQDQIDNLILSMPRRSKYENLTDKRIKKIRTDNGLEFVNEQLDTYLANSGIFHEKTISYNIESNGKAERANRVLLERTRSLLYENKLPLKFWAEAISCSTQVSNITPRKGKEKSH
ncbi:retrovirus-related Pol polyprotein from transposon TNT 1-94 [Trichonephila clavipes]|uniref:Retrovirus-related Pol polyprotein from transposon TNT 1-94 n=1 Tax=Trichonephila clavipes TaxID=2585209 RepID=A0A8X6VZ51_TRICX|nr:retrovirus-related Pol polyprotein from transposon TNT 1-94 [Trichonephila clavipes]